LYAGWHDSGELCRLLRAEVRSSLFFAPRAPLAAADLRC